MRTLFNRPPRADWIALALLTLAVMIFFSPVLFAGYWLPSGGGDLTSLLWPNFRFAGRMLHAGQLPLWTPHLFGGMPFWADNQSAVLYPPNLLVMLIFGGDVPYGALEALVIGHIWLAGVSMYACLRLLPGDGSPAPAALVGALAWAFSDVFVTHIGNYNLNAVAAWLPLIVLGTWRALHDRSVHWAMLGGVALGLSTLAGHAQVTYLIGLTLAALTLWLLAGSLLEARRVDNPILKAGGQVLLMAGIVAVIGLGLSAAGWLPTLHLTGYTARAGLSYEQAAAYSVPPKALIGLIAPWVYGRGPGGFSGAWDRVEVGYMGALALLLALIGLSAALRDARRDRRLMALFWGVLALIALLGALGSYFPLHRLAYDLLPGFDQIRVPARLVLLFNFGGALLAALGVEWLLGRITMPRGVEWLPALLVAAELIAFGMTVEISRDDPRVGFDQPGVLAWLADQPGAAQGAPYRIDSTYGGWQPHLAQWSGTLYDAYGFSQPLALSDYESYWWSVGYRGSPMYNFLGIKYVVAGDEPPGDASFIPQLPVEDGPTVYLNSGALPLAHLIGDVVAVEKMGDAWDAVHDPAWNPATTAYIENPQPLSGDSGEPGELAFWEYAPNRITLHAVTEQDAYLVLAEVDYPGWRVTIDGEQAQIDRANLAFRAVYVPPGDHVITFRFVPGWVYAGIAVSVVTLLGVIGWLAVARRAGRSAAEPVEMRRD